MHMQGVVLQPFSVQQQEHISTTQSVRKYIWRSIKEDTMIFDIYPVFRQLLEQWGHFMEVQGHLGGKEPYF